MIAVGSSDDENKRRRARNLALFAVLAGLAAVFYVITIIKFTGGGG